MTYYTTIDWATEIYLTNLCFILQDLKLNNLQGLVPVRALLCSYKCFNSKGHDYYGVAFPWITRQREREKYFFFLAFDVCRICMVIRFFHPRHKGQWPPTSKDVYTRSYPWHYFLILILEKEPVFPFSMLGAKQGNYWYHFYNVFGMTRSLTGDWTWDLPHSKPALYH